MNIEELKKKILKKIYTGVADSKKKLLFDTIKFPAKIKFDFINDGKVLVVYDIPITKEGVQEYADGFHYKPKEEIEKLKVDYSPISLDHPGKHFNLMDEKVALSTIVGYTADSYFKDNKKYANFYHFVDKLNESAEGKEVLNRIKDGNSVDVSMGFYADFQKEEGNFDGKDYQTVQRSIVYDHVAELPFIQGRFSFTEGIGIGADKSKEVSTRTISNGVILKIIKDGDWDNAAETYYPSQGEAEEAMKSMSLLDSLKNNTEVNSMENVKEIVKIVQDSIKAEDDSKKVQDTLNELQKDKKTLGDKVKEIETQNKELADAKKELDIIKEAEKKKSEDEKKELVDEILKLDKDSESIISEMDNDKLKAYLGKIQDFKGIKPSKGDKHPLSGAAPGSGKDNDFEEAKAERKNIFGTSQREQKNNKGDVNAK